MRSKKVYTKIVEDFATGKGASEISQEYGVSRKTVYNMLALHQNSGSLDARMQNVGQKPALNQMMLEQLEE